MIQSFILSLSTSLVYFFIFTCLHAAEPVYGQAPETRTGVIITTMDASGYTYLHLDTEGGKIWVALPVTKVKKGDKVSYRDGITMQEFHSKTLDKTFDHIIFSPGLEGEDVPQTPLAELEKNSSTNSFAEAVQAESANSAESDKEHALVSGGSSGAIVVPSVEVQVEKVTGEDGYSIAEIFSKAPDLNGKQVRVRGKVVKFNPNIMGKNWIHIQDGSGDPMKNTHDMVIVTTAQIQLAEIVVIKGLLAANKDFGFGYKYDAIIEEAMIVQ